MTECPLHTLWLGWMCHYYGSYDESWCKTHVLMHRNNLIYGDGI